METILIELRRLASKAKTGDGIMLTRYQIHGPSPEQEAATATRGHNILGLAWDNDPLEGSLEKALFGN